MPTPTYQPQSATILQFPTALARSWGNVNARSQAIEEARQPKRPPVVYGGSWYHEAAILDAEDGHRA